ncbi:MAG: hypothetical protein HYV45_02000 [Candidatus Moranbacteria bacterium]|nr:hypothetical protein [Candidatus Moranbacteria bacterium]
MSETIFSQKKFSGKEAIARVAEIGKMVHTMEGDLDEIKNGKAEPKMSFDEKKEGGTNAPFAQEKGMNTASPFGVKIEQNKIPEDGLVQGNKLENGLKEIIPATLTVEQPKKSKKWLFLLCAILFLAGSLGAAWYFFFDGRRFFVPAPPLLDEISKEDQVKDPLEVPEREKIPFALDKPNYLSINTETATPESILALFFQTSRRAKEAEITVPVEFYITDHNNNPLAFSRLAFLLKLNVDPELLLHLDESFSLYVFNDGEDFRFGFVFALKDSAAASTLLQKTESSLPQFFQPFLGVMISKQEVFQSSVYKEYTVRYSNLDISKNISIDYTIYNNRWYVGTSKNTLRALLDRNQE